jgi:hypothetical protein
VEVAGILDRFAQGNSKPWEWDDFLSTQFTSDPLLSEVQKRMNQVSEQFPSDAPGQYCSEEGIAYILESARKLRDEAQLDAGCPTS